MITFSWRAENDSVSISPTPSRRACRRHSAPKRLDVEVVGAAPDLLVDREADAHGRARLGRCLAEVGDGGHDLRHACLVVGAEQRRAVARDDVVPDPRRERRLLAPGRAPGSGRPAARSARRRSPRGRSGRRPHPATRATYRRARQADHGRARRARQRRVDVADARSARRRRARSRAAPPRGSARGRAASRCSGTSSRPPRTACRCGRSGGSARALRRRARPRAARRTGR